MQNSGSVSPRSSPFSVSSSSVSLSLLVVFPDPSPSVSATGRTPGPSSRRTASQAVKVASSPSGLSLFKQRSPSSVLRSSLSPLERPRTLAVTSPRPSAVSSTASCSFTSLACSLCKCSRSSRCSDYLLPHRSHQSGADLSAVAGVLSFRPMTRVSFTTRDHRPLPGSSLSVTLVSLLSPPSSTPSCSFRLSRPE